MSVLRNCWIGIGLESSRSQARQVAGLVGLAPLLDLVSSITLIQRMACATRTDFHRSSRFLVASPAGHTVGHTHRSALRALHVCAEPVG